MKNEIIATLLLTLGAGASGSQGDELPPLVFETRSIRFFDDDHLLLTSYINNASESVVTLFGGWAIVNNEESPVLILPFESLEILHGGEIIQRFESTVSLRHIEATTGFFSFGNMGTAYMLDGSVSVKTPVQISKIKVGFILPDQFLTEIEREESKNNVEGGELQVRVTLKHFHLNETEERFVSDRTLVGILPWF